MGRPIFEIGVGNLKMKSIETEQTMRPAASPAINVKYTPPLRLPFQNVSSLIFKTRNGTFPLRRASTAMCELTTALQVKEEIELTNTEKKIFDTVVNTLPHFNLSTQLRVAGGWVRDKVVII